MFVCLSVLLPFCLFFSHIYLWMYIGFNLAASVCLYACVILLSAACISLSLSFCLLLSLLLVYLSFCVPAYFYINMSAYVCVFLCVALYHIILFVFMSFCLPIFLYILLCVCVCAYVGICHVLERSTSSTWGQSVSTGQFRAVVSVHGCRGQNHRYWCSERGHFQGGMDGHLFYCI